MNNKHLLFLCAVLTAIGCFLPWEMEGDFINYVTYGVRLFPWFDDSGGLLILILTGLVVYLFTSPAGFIPRSHRIGLILSGLNLATAVFFVGRWAVHAIYSSGVIRQTTLGIGLILVAIGTAGMMEYAYLESLSKENRKNILIDNNLE